jgi:membrane-bound lytic murein transglycosylase D
MNIRKIIAVALAAAFAVTAGAQEKKIKIVRKAELKKENALLRTELDSLKAELEKYRIELEQADSIASEMMGLYEDDQVKSAEEIAPEEYTSEISDSLLNIWYESSTGNDEYIDDFDLDSARFQSNVPDEVYLERLRKMNPFITLPYNDIVKNYIILYSEKMPTRMSQMLGLCEYYMPIFEETLNRHGMPEELKAMAIIESALNPLALSRVGAK